jgi:HEAT repeat protein
MSNLQIAFACLGTMVTLYSVALLIEWGRYRWTVMPLQSDNAAVREQAVKELRGGGPETVGVLAKALSDADVRIRLGAARALGEFDPEVFELSTDPVPSLRAATNDTDPDVRQAAAQSLQKFGWKP